MKETKLKQQIKECYIYGYPIVGMYQLLSAQVLDPSTAECGFNEFSHTAQLSDPKTSFVPAPNNDTTYSRAWLDLRSGPVYITVPDTHDRFYSIQFLDLFSDTIQNVGKRTTGTKPATFAVIGPDDHTRLSDDVISVKSRTPLALAFLRILVKDEADLAEVRKLQQSIQIKASCLPDSSATLPVYRNASAPEFFATLLELLDLIPILPGESVIHDQIREVSQASGDLLTEAADATLKEIDAGGMQFGESVHYWRIARKEIGTYGNNYMQRAVVWFKGALANCPEESLYPSTFQDSNGERLDGRNRYRLTFTASGLPPVSQFWSVTLYIFSNGFLYANEIDRYSIGDRTDGLYYEEDGSLTLYIQTDPPEGSARANWLPAPPEPFYLTMRLYGPSPEAVSGQWNPPAVDRIV